MEITDKILQETVKESLRNLPIKIKCLEFDIERKFYVRGEVHKLQKENCNMKFKTKSDKNTLLVWRIL